MKALVIGTSIIDLFVEQKLEYDSVIRNNTVAFTLGDKVPIDIKKLSLGGNGANVSTSLTRLGIPTSFYTYLGDDVLSQEIASIIQKEGINLQAEQHPGYSSLSFIFDFDVDRIIFSHHPSHDHNFNYTGEAPEYIYLTSLGNPWEEAFRKINDFVIQNNINLAFSPGSLQLASTNDMFFETLHNSKYLFINKEEAEHILKSFGSSFTDMRSMLTELKKLGPTIVSITDGKEGAYSLDESNTMLHIKPLDTTQATEKTGAGDAYAAGFLAGIIEGKSTSESMRQGSMNSYAVMKDIGATAGLLHKENMLQLLSEHQDFQPIQV